VLLGYGIAQSMLGRPLRIRISNVVRDSRQSNARKTRVSFSGDPMP
jgi:hypothetical protein